MREILIVFPEVFFDRTGMQSHGGIQRFCRNLLRATTECCRHKFFVHALSLVDPPNTTPPAGYFPSHPGSYRSFGRNRKQMLAAFVNRLRLLTEVSPLVLLAGINFALLAPLTKSLQRKAVVVMILHGYEVFEPLPFSRKFLLRWCDGFWAVSYSTRKLFCEKQGVPPDRVKVIYHGIEPHWIIEGETALKLRVDRKKDGDFTLKFLCVTRMRPHDIGKKVDVLLQAFSKVRIDHPHVHLTIVGDGERRYVYENLAKDLSLHQSVTFTGDISDQALYELYRNSDVFVLPSVKEGFGLVFLEAMAFGLPCIGAKATSVPEIIENERSGLLADPDHVDNLALQMARLADSADMRTKLGEAGRRRVVECFGFDRFAKNINSFLTDFSSCKTLDKAVF